MKGIKKMKKIIGLLLVLGCLFNVTLPALAEEVVNVYNWFDYIDESVLKMFTEETGIKVNYMGFTTNEDMLVQVEATPSAFDVVFPSEYCVERLINLDLLEKIDYANVPNIEQIDPNLLDPDYDPQNTYSVPYMWGTLGILYNTKMVEEPVTSWGILWDEKYMNNVFMLDSFRDSIGLILKYKGKSRNTRETFDFEEAKDLLIVQKK